MPGKTSIAVCPGVLQGLLASSMCTPRKDNQMLPKNRFSASQDGQFDVLKNKCISLWCHLSSANRPLCQNLIQPLNKHLFCFIYTVYFFLWRRCQRILIMFKIFFFVQLKVFKQEMTSVEMFVSKSRRKFTLPRATVVVAMSKTKSSFAFAGAARLIGLVPRAG